MMRRVISTLALTAVLAAPAAAQDQFWFEGEGSPGGSLHRRNKVWFCPTELPPSAPTSAIRASADVTTSATTV